jgi:hypothetical protein
VSQARAATPTWQLLDYGQKGCIRPSNPYTDLITYVGIWINGTWTHSINAGLSSTPEGSTTWSNSVLPLPPGSSDGVGGLATIALQIPRSTVPAIYTVQLWASDGTSTQQVPFTLRVAPSTEKCSSY